MFDLLTALLDSWTLWANIAGNNAKAIQWRMTCLQLTYRQGAYRPYEELVALAAKETGLPQSCTDTLVKNWKHLKPWTEVNEVLAELKNHVPLAVVTNCSEVLGQQAAGVCGVTFDVFVTSERAGFYKPAPAPYTLTIQELGIEPKKVLYVSGSAYDIPGAVNMGMDVFWHNRIGMVKPERIPEPLLTANSLMPLKEFIWNI